MGTNELGAHGIGGRDGDEGGLEMLGFKDEEVQSTRVDWLAAQGDRGADEVERDEL